MIPELHHYHLADEVTAFSTTRHGGYSQGGYGAFNVNLFCGDDVEAIQKNRQLLCQSLAIQPDRLLMPHQVHGVEVRRVTQDFLELPASERQAVLEGVDALMTDVKEVCIGVSTADCIPLIIYDPEHTAASVIHAGWRGTVSRIVQHTVKAMVEAYGSDAGKLKAVIGPGISLQSFEVGDEVYTQFAEAGFLMESISCKMPAMNGGMQEKWHIDLWACNRLQLLEAGLPSEQIQVSGICTYEHYEDYFSARRLGINSGRILTAVVVHEPK